MKIFGFSKKNKGFITLMSVMVIGAIGVVIITSLVLLGIGNSRTSFTYEQGNQAKALTNTCAEEALQQIRDSTPFTGSGGLSLGQGSCSYTVTSQGSQNRTIVSRGNIGAVVRRVKIVINKINPTIEVVSWQEVSDF